MAHLSRSPLLLSYIFAAAPRSPSLYCIVIIIIIPERLVITVCLE